MISRLQQVELGLELRAHGQALGELLADDGARVGLRVHRMPHAVHETRLVESLLVDDLRQVVGHLTLVGPVGHVLLDLLLHS